MLVREALLYGVYGEDTLYKYRFCSCIFWRRLLDWRDSCLPALWGSKLLARFRPALMSSKRATASWVLASTPTDRIWERHDSVSKRKKRTLGGPLSWWNSFCWASCQTNQRYLYAVRSCAGDTPIIPHQLWIADGWLWPLYDVRELDGCYWRKMMCQCMMSSVPFQRVDGVIGRRLPLAFLSQLDF